MSSNYLENLFGLSGKTAVVIGGAGVLGGGLCAGLARPRHVVVADLTEEGCKARVKAIEALGGKASYCTVNVTGANRSKTCWPKHSKQTGRAESWSTPPA